MKENKNILINRMIETIEQHNLIQPGDNVVVGVSGGADSVSLLLSLYSIRDQFDLDITVCHVNHKIRTETAERDQRFVEDLCESLGVKCYIKEAFVEELAKQWNMGTEEAGRKVRYDFFNEIAGKNGKIATAHNKNDNAETVMMRFMRGTGLHGLTGIPYQRGNIIRPLLDISRDEIEEFLSDLNQEYVTDESNLDPVYTRNKIRLNLIPSIQKEFNPNFIETLSGNISNYREEDEFLSQCAERVVADYFEIDKKRVWVNKGILTKEHISVVKRAIRIVFTKVFDLELSLQAVNGVVELFGKTSGAKMTVSGDIIASVQHSGIFIQDGVSDKIAYEFLINSAFIGGGVGCFNNNGIVIRYEIVETENVINDPTTFYYPVTACQSGLTLRTRRNGDTIVIAPGIRKKLKKFFIDEKIDAVKRDEYWVLTNENNEIVWIPGLFGSRLKEEERSGQFVRFQVVG